MGPARHRETGRMTLGSMNHLGITVSDLAASTERFSAPLLGFLGYRLVASLPEMSLWLAPAGQAINLWQAHAALAGKAPERSEPGLHHPLGSAHASTPVTTASPARILPSA